MLADETHSPQTGETIKEEILSWPTWAERPTNEEVIKYYLPARIAPYRIVGATTFERDALSGFAEPTTRTPDGNYTYTQPDELANQARAKYAEGLVQFSQHLGELITDPQFLELMAINNMGNKLLSRATIESFAKMQALDADTINRLYIYINYGVDIELTILKLHKYRQEGLLASGAIEAFSTNNGLQEQYAKTLFDTRIGYTPKNEQLVAQKQEQLDHLADMWDRAIGTASVGLKQGDSGVKALLQLQKPKEWARYSGAFSAMESFDDFNTSRELITFWNIYEKKYKQPVYMVLKPESTMWSLFIEYGQTIEIGRYALGLSRTVDKILYTQMPELEAGVPITEMDYGDDTIATVPREMQTCHGGYSRGKIEFKAGREPKVYGEELFMESLVGKNKVTGKRCVLDAIVYAHERAHSIFDKINEVDQNLAPHFARMDNMSRAVNEGFALTIELLFMRVLRDNQQLLGLNEQDIDTINNYIRARGQELQKAQNAYTLGLAQIMWHVYLEGEKQKGTETGATGGITRIQEYVASMDAQKLHDTKLEDPYMQEIFQRLKKPQERSQALVDLQEYFKRS